jgi:high-affinity K+ transport system ATPase subunit B
LIFAIVLITMSHAAHLKKAIEQVQHKQPVPHIDFTIHQLDDGNTVSTQERVIKEVSHVPYLQCQPLMALALGASTSDASSDGRSVLFNDRSDQTRHCLSQKPLLS